MIPENSVLMPSDLQAVPEWSQLLTRPEFPILEDTRHRIHQVLRDRQVNFQHLAPIVERDPALSLNLQMIAVHQNPDCLHQISGAANCISLIGLQEVVRLVKQLPVIPHQTTDEKLLAYRSALQTAHMASHLAAWWSTLKGNNSDHHARWATLMLGAPIWAWLLHDDQARNLWHWISRRQEPWQALLQLSGANHLRQWQTLARKLAMPPLAAEVWNPGRWPSLYQWQQLRRHDPWDLPDKLARPMLHEWRQPHLTPILATALATWLHIDPDSSRCQRWIQLASHWLGKPPGFWSSNLVELQLSSARLQLDPGGAGIQHWLQPQPQAMFYPWIPAPEAVMAVQRQRGRSLDTTTAPAQPSAVTTSTGNRQSKAGRPLAAAPQNQDTTAKNTTQGTEQPASRTTTTGTPARAAIAGINGTPTTTANKLAPVEPATADHRHAAGVPATATTPAASNTLSPLQNQLRNDPASFGDWHQLMKALLHGVLTDIGLPWAAVLLLNRDKTALRLVYQEGLSEHSPLRTLQLPLESQNLFSKLMEKPNGLMVTPDHRARLLRNVPERLRQILPEYCLLMSITAGNRPIGMVMSGTNPGQQPPTIQTWTAFRGLCQSGSQGLFNLRQRASSSRTGNS